MHSNLCEHCSTGATPFAGSSESLSSDGREACSYLSSGAIPACVHPGGVYDILGGTYIRLLSTVVLTLVSQANSLWWKSNCRDISAYKSAVLYLLFYGGYYEMAAIAVVLQTLLEPWCMCIFSASGLRCLSLVTGILVAAGQVIKLD